jgi:predicted RNA-binding protein
MPTYWIVVGLPENFEIATKRGFDMFGFKSTRRSETSSMHPGDKLIFYLTGVKEFAGLATITSEVYEEHNKVFKSEKKPNEDFPFRVKTRAEVVLPEGKRLSVPDYVPRLEKTRKGAMKSWGMAFQGNLHRISNADYKLIEKDMRARTKSKAKASSKGNGVSKSKSTQAPKRNGASKPKAATKSRTKSRA